MTNATKRNLWTIAWLGVGTMGCAAESAVDADDGKFLLAARADCSADASAVQPDAANDASAIATMKTSTPPASNNEADVTFAEVTAFGGDCTVTPTISADRKSVSVALENAVVEVGLDVPLKSMVCSVSMSVKVPNGQSYAVEEFAADGTVSLQEGVSAQVDTYYNFTALAPISVGLTSFQGPFEGPVAIRASFVGDKRNFGPCNTTRDLEVGFRLLAHAGSSKNSGRIELNSFRPIRFALRALHELSGWDNGKQDGHMPNHFPRSARRPDAYPRIAL